MDHGRKNTFHSFPALKTKLRTGHELEQQPCVAGPTVYATQNSNKLIVNAAYLHLPTCKLYNTETAFPLKLLDKRLIQPKGFFPLEMQHDRNMRRKEFSTVKTQAFIWANPKLTLSGHHHAENVSGWAASQWKIKLSLCSVRAFGCIWHFASKSDQMIELMRNV